VSVAVRELLWGGAMAEARITSYRPRDDTPPGAQVSALAAIFKFIINCHEKRAAAENRPDDAKESDVSRHKYHNK
jgi:hypothetical protein